MLKFNCMIGSVDMKIKKFLFCMFLILCVFSFSIVEAASPDSFTVQKSGSINETGLILRGGDIPAHFTYKYANVNGTNYIVLCTGYRGANIYNFSFRKDNSWSAPVRAGIAAIIKDGIGDNATTSSIPNDEQSLKALAPIVVGQSPNTTFFSNRQPLNPYAPTDVTLLGIFISFIAAHP